MISEVLTAVADPTRRSILEQLRLDGPRSIKEIAAPLPMSRQAVTKHLGALERAGLIRVEWAGRERLHRLVPTPLREVEDWLEPYAAFWDDRLERLKRHLEKK